MSHTHLATVAEVPADFKRTRRRAALRELALPQKDPVYIGFRSSWDRLVSLRATELGSKNGSSQIPRRRIGDVNWKRAR